MKGDSAGPQSPCPVCSFIPSPNCSEYKRIEVTSILPLLDSVLSGSLACSPSPTFLTISLHPYALSLPLSFQPASSKNTQLLPAFPLLALYPCPLPIPISLC